MSLDLLVRRVRSAVPSGYRRLFSSKSYKEEDLVSSLREVLGFYGDRVDWLKSHCLEVAYEFYSSVVFSMDRRATGVHRDLARIVYVYNTDKYGSSEEFLRLLDSSAMSCAKTILLAERLRSRFDYFSRDFEPATVLSDFGGREREIVVRVVEADTREEIYSLLDRVSIEDILSACASYFEMFSDETFSVVDAVEETTSEVEDFMKALYRRIDEMSDEFVSSRSRPDFEEKYDELMKEVESLLRRISDASPEVIRLVRSLRDRIDDYSKKVDLERRGS